MRIVDAVNSTRIGFVRVVLLRFVVPIVALVGTGWILENEEQEAIMFTIRHPLTLLVVLADLLWIFAPERRRLHDYLAGTKVVRSRKKRASPAESRRSSAV